jgi:hypothetical protein
MRAKVSRRLVIDASVARSSGGEDATYPLSKQCRDFLKKTLAVCHRVVLTPSVRAEWKKHESRFAREWRTAMMARKRLVLADMPEDAALREAIEDAAETERGRSARLKDAHLVEAAQATDRTVVSLDDTVRGLFGAASKRVRVLGTVVWANPGHEAEDCSTWLDEGAPPDKHRQLGAWRPGK